MKDLACLHCAPLLTPSFTIDVLEDPDLVQQLNSTQEETATHDPVEEDLSSVNFVVGDKFSSYNDLKKKLSEFEKSQSVQLTHKDSRTLESAAKRVPKRVENANSALEYYTIHFSCVFGGKKYTNRGSGKRPHQRYTD